MGKSSGGNRPAEGGGNGAIIYQTQRCEVKLLQRERLCEALD